MRWAALAVVAVGSAIFLSRTARADNEIAWGAVLCLAGEAAGQGGGGSSGSCSGYMEA